MSDLGWAIINGPITTAIKAEGLPVSLTIEWLARHPIHAPAFLSPAGSEDRRTAVAEARAVLGLDDLHSAIPDDPRRRFGRDDPDPRRQRPL